VLPLCGKQVPTQYLLILYSIHLERDDVTDKAGCPSEAQVT